MLSYDENDWHGGRNRFCSIRNIPTCIRGIYNGADVWGECVGNR